MARLKRQAQKSFSIWKKTADEIGKMDDAAIADLPQTTRDTLLEHLAQSSPAGIGRIPSVKTAFNRLLLASEYPANIAQNDIEITQKFYARWQQERSGYLKHQDSLSLEETFQFMASTAAYELGLYDRFSDNVRIGVRFIDFELEGQKTAKTSDYLPFMGMHATFAPNGDFHILLILNENHYMWHLTPFTADDYDNFAMSVWHEISHAGQIAEMLRPSKETPDFYREMKKQKDLLMPFVQHFDIYRSMLHERQSYFRTALFSSLTGTTELKSERAYLAEDFEAYAKSLTDPNSLDAFYLDIASHDGPTPKMRREP